MEEYPKPEEPLALQAAKGLENAQILHVVDSGDAGLVRGRLGLQEGVAQHAGRKLGQNPPGQIHRQLEQHPGGLSRRIPHDAAPLGVGCVAGDPRPGECCGVDPRRVDIQ